MATDKYCVFCGNTPEKKNKEHIIPQWLIKHTGDPNRMAFFGYTWATGKFEKREFSWNSFSFPACEACNSKWAQLEEQVKSTLLSMLDGGLVTAGELNTLMDWFDKVRIGLWLGMLYLNKNYMGIDPHFYIAERIAQKDRALLIFQSIEREKVIGLNGTDTPIFHRMPSVFHIIINQLHFVSVSYDFFIAERFGWPYVSEIWLADDDTDKLEMLPTRGTNQVQPPIIGGLPWPSGSVLLQPIIPRRFVHPKYPEQLTELYGNDYVKSCLRKPEIGLGHIYIDNSSPTIYPDTPSDLWKPETWYVKSTLIQQLDLWSAKLQRTLYSHIPDNTGLTVKSDDFRSKEVSIVLKIQDEIIKQIERQSRLV